MWPPDGIGPLKFCSGPLSIPRPLICGLWVVFSVSSLLEKPCFQAILLSTKFKESYKSLENPVLTYFLNKFKDIASIESPLASNIISGMTMPKKKDLIIMVPTAHPEALDLMRKLFVFNPNLRLTAS
jgi:hypothetical protein